MKKGFSLIELLAVIIIIGIVGLITTPIISGVLRESRKGAFEDSVYNVIKAVDLDKADSGFNINRVYTVTNGAISPHLEVKGSVNGTGTIKLDEDGNVQLILEYDLWCATKEYESKTVVIRSAPCIPNSDTSGANSPWLLSNMIPVRWDGTKWVKADRRNPAATPWYSYGQTAGTRNWANAVLVGETGTYSRDYYESDAAIDREVVAADILAHLVWIPRFNYAIPSGAGARAISINFEEGVPNAATGNGVGTSFKTHPAFTFGDKELTGFWFGKFETTGTLTNMTILPSIASLRSNALINVYQSVNELALPDNVYGFITSRVDMRITKNTEWGAVTYLTNSLYGKNATLWKNPSTTYLTGCAGTTATASGAAGCSHYYTSANGQQASTTGNIYGIYDMAGGAFDFVMGNYLDVPSQSGINMLPNIKYYNKYTTTNASTACNNQICLGHSLSETSGWYSGTTNFLTYTNPWMLRGNVSNINTASQFAFDNYNGASASNVGFRLTVSNK
jgi:prepilin-type N-terminal cleavage/methylation domain-containing protein